MRQEMGAGKEINDYLKTLSLDSFGYMRLSNLVERHDLEEAYHCSTLRREGRIDRAMIKRTLKNIDIPEGDIPIFMDLPNRPEDETNIQDMGLSVAELAGVAASLKLTTGRETNFIGITNLGRFARRWFDVKEIPLTNTAYNNWMLRARGKQGLEKLDARSSLVQARGRNLMNKYDVKIEQTDTDVVVRTGNLETVLQKEGIYTHAKDKWQVKKADIHAYRGFLQAFALETYYKRGINPLIKLDDSPLIPYSTLSGYHGADKVLQVDRIPSYV